MTCTEALTALMALGPFSLAAGIAVGYLLHRDNTGRATHDRRL